MLAFESGLVGGLVKDVFAQQFLETWQAEAALNERAHTRGNEHGGCFKLRTLVGLHMPLAVFCGFEFTHQFLQVKLRCEGFDLGLQLVNQFLTGAKWNAGYVVNGFVGVKLGTLAAHLWQCIHHVALDVLKP